jgi:GDP-D-mannose dehydratase
MANTIGESLSRIYEMRGYDVTRVCYPSDIGRNVAMGVWGVMQRENEKPEQGVSLKDKVTFLGACYAYANEQFETNEEAKKQIIEVNKDFYRPAEVPTIFGDCSKAKKVLNWNPEYTFKDLVFEMCETEMEKQKNAYLRKS